MPAPLFLALATPKQIFNPHKTEYIPVSTKSGIRKKRDEYTIFHRKCQL